MGQPTPVAGTSTSKAQSTPQTAQTTHSKDTAAADAQLEAFLALLLGLVSPQNQALPPPSGKPFAGKTLPTDGKAKPASVPAKSDALLLELLKFVEGKSIKGTVTADKLAPRALATLKAAMLKLGDAGHLNKAQMETALQQLLKDSAPSPHGQLDHSAATPSSVPSALQSVQPQAITARLPTPVVQGPRFAQDMAEHVQWMTQSGQQFARVAVSPAHLGPVDIQIRLDGNQAQVLFGAHHEAAREALQTAVPRLREVMDASGLQLVQVDVSGHGANPGHQGGAGQQHFAGAWDYPSVGTVSESVSMVQGPIMTGRCGLVDDYA